MSTVVQRQAALELAMSKRMALTDLRRRIRTGEVTLVDLLDDPPACVHGMGVIDVLRLGYKGSGRTRVPRHIEVLGRDAARDGINLLVPIDRASLRTRRWVAVRARWFLSNGRSRCELRIEDAA